MSFKDIMGHQRAIAFLQRAIAQEKVVHSYLFVGHEGVGKSLVALQFAKALNCLDGEKAVDGCDRCPSCRKIDHGLHPDVSLIEPEGQTLRVEQVREMLSGLAYRPFEGRRRVLILSAADRMAPHMSNTLLKTLEETPLHTVIILIATSTRWILPTILSRCQPVRFHPIPYPLVADWLIQVKGLEAKEAHLLALLSEGSPGHALSIRQELAGLPRRDLLRWIASKSLSPEEQEGWIESFPGQREPLRLLLEVAKTLLRDLMVRKTSLEPSKLIHADLASEIERYAEGWTLPHLLRRMEGLHHATKAIRANANTRLALETLMLSWAEG
ncbi:MAG: DNA polymerase III subunit delta' [Desulfobacterota bacterium]|nr:DNA polymerase III subunit delta' [Thermodesulfobacteriota bacterium]